MRGQRAMKRLASLLCVGGMAAFCASLFAAPQADPEQPPPPVQPPQLVPALPGGIIIQGNGRLIIQNGAGGLIIQGNMLPEPNLVAPPDFPIVSDGFAIDKDVEGPITPLVEALRSPEYFERQRATMALMRLPPKRLTDVERALEQESDSEAIARLSEVAEHLYLKPRTAIHQPSLLGIWFKQPMIPLLGVRFKLEPVRLRSTDENLTMSVLVMEVQAGFPAAQELETGDRIVGIGGKRFPITMDDNAFPAMVKQYDPGSLVNLQLMRDGKVEDVTIQMAGLEVADAIGMTAIIDQRNAAAAEFVKTLRTGETPKPLIMKDTADAGMPRGLRVSADSPVDQARQARMLDEQLQLQVLQTRIQLLKQQQQQMLLQRVQNIPAAGDGNGR